MSELIHNREYRIKALKELIMDLHRGKSVDEVKQRFKEIIKDVSAEEVSAMEQALIQEGMPVEEVQRLCDVHAAIFKDVLEQKPEPHAIPGHPLNTFFKENRAIEKLIDTEINPRLEGLKNAPAESEREAALSLLEKVNLLFDVEKHYKRKEELLFPYLEKYGIYGPSKVMWGVDDEIRNDLKQVRDMLYNYRPGSKAEVVEKVTALTNKIKEMIFKEEKILLPTAEQKLTEDEWYEIYRSEDEIGYCLVEPEAEWKPQRVDLDKMGETIADDTTKGFVKFPTGMLTPKEIELIFNHLPVDITFVDKDDTVRYFSATKERIFTRPKTIIGRKVQNCHPPASYHIVEKILRNFKEGKKDVEEFWINLHGKLVYIRYFAVRDEAGNYMGTIEVTQEISRIKELQGEKRLLED
ncbi:DUF438 domain-containing protein [Thermosediminibacter litoriperuensis]|uniref:PAC domain-containing protein n=1 Tax=Thermosediminibacter litoriperuensis TaxID=291989 RepID=A0A5S5AVG3_9FIRM|nr:DUF438 domain-containing protein [Thermosediminibacter litoriperuensis]TYP56098.1 hypothetical protein LZ11_01019 [Thermosediminibacter litoriperuensis]